MKKSSLRAQTVKRTFCFLVVGYIAKVRVGELETDLVGVIQMQKLASLFIDSFMAFAHAGHGQCSIHVIVMACQIETDQALEKQRPAWPGAAQENEQASGGTAVCDHV